MATKILNRFILTNTTTIREASKGNPDIEGVFPRWISLGQIANPLDEMAGSTGSFVAYGVTKVLYFEGSTA